MTPVSFLIEAIGGHLDGWKPANGQELTEFIDGLPELVEKFQETLRSTIQDIIEDDANQVSEDWIAGPADELDGALRAAHDSAAELARDYHDAGSFWIGGDS
jgi:hypothetical protein